MPHTTRLPALSWLWGARVQRVDGPTPDSIALSVFTRSGKHVLLLAFSPVLRGVGSVAVRPKGAPASPFVRRLRTQLDGARLHAAHWLTVEPSATEHSHEASATASEQSREPSATASEGGAATPRRVAALLLAFERAEHTAQIALDFDARAPNLFLLQADGGIAGAAHERGRRARFPGRSDPYVPGRGGFAAPESEAALAAAGSALAGERTQRADERERQQAQAQSRVALRKLERKIAAIKGDLARAEQVPQLRREASLLLASLTAIPRGAARARLLDESVTPAEWLEISLDPAKPPQHAAEQRFVRARKLERGAGIASARLAEAQTAAARLRRLMDRLAAEPLEQLAPEARALGLTLDPSREPRRKMRVPERQPYRTFVGHGAREIFVGKNAADNDHLTLRVARPHDHWLHVRGTPGSHVVVPLERNAALAPDLLIDAAHLAAHFSQQRGESRVEIAHTERRFVRKAKGTPAGTVTLDRERVFLLRLEPERLARLLASERPVRSG